MNPANIKIGELFLAKFACYPLWPIRILEVMTTDTGDCKFVVFCYGKKHDHQHVSVANLLSFNDNEKEASIKKTKGVNHAFDELKNHPDVYRQFLKKGHYSVTDSQLSNPTANLRSLVAATEDELAATKQNLAEEIKKKIDEKLKDLTSQTTANIHANFPVETMVSEIYDAVHIEFQPKFELIEKHLKTCTHMIESLQNHVNEIELKLDDIEQEERNDSLLFNGVKQISSQSFGDVIKHVLFVKMGLTNIAVSDIVSVKRFSVFSNIAQRPDKVAPVLVQFGSKEKVRHVFKANK